MNSPRGSATCCGQLAALLCVAVATFGCNAIPQPVPIPVAPDQALLRVEGGAESPAPLVMIGLPGSVSGAGVVTIDGRALVHSESNEDGAFVAVVEAATGDTLSLRFGGSEPTKLEVVAEAFVIQTLPPQLETGTSLEPDARGLVHLAVRSSGSLAGIIAVNRRTGEVVVAPEKNAEGAYEATLAATQGDTLTIYANIHPLGPALELQVP